MTADAPLSIARASGTWYATFLSLVFALSQASDWAFDRPVLVSAGVWTLIGLTIDVWSRRRPVDVGPTFAARGPLMLWIILFGGLFAAGWTVFRPSPTAVVYPAWLSLANATLDSLNFILPGLRHGRAALVEAGRPDIAAYFGLFQVSLSIVWVVSLAIWTMRFSTLAASAVRTPALVAVVQKAYVPSPAPLRYLWRALFTATVGFLYLAAIVSLIMFWHQDVVGVSNAKMRFLQNVITGPGAFVWAPMAGILVGPLAAFGAIAWRGALRIQRDLAKRQSPA